MEFDQEQQQPVLAKSDLLSLNGVKDRLLVETLPKSPMELLQF
jgi:hypothetical protein